MIPILNAIVLFPIVYVMKKFNFGASLLAYGILSIIGYCMFLAWMLATAPKGDNKVEVADDHFSELGAALSLGFAIQTFFIPILKQNPNSHFYKRLLIITFLLGTSVYTYIGYSGAFSNSFFMQVWWIGSTQEMKNLKQSNNIFKPNSGK